MLCWSGPVSYDHRSVKITNMIKITDQ